MADIIRYPKQDDQIEAGVDGATLYYFENAKYYPWKWDGVAVKLSPGDQFHTTGVHKPVPELGGEVIEIYYWRRKGAKDIYPTESAARGDFLNGVGNFFTFSPDKIVYETKLVKWSEVTPSYNSGNEEKDPKTDSELGREQIEQEAYEKQLQEQVYSVSPEIPRHTRLFKNDGVWYAAWANGNTYPIDQFISLPLSKKLAIAQPKTDAGLTDGKNGGKKDTATIPTWLYWVLGGTFAASLIFLLFQKLKKTKK